MTSKAMEAAEKEVPLDVSVEPVVVYSGRHENGKMYHAMTMPNTMRDLLKGATTIAGRYRVSPNPERMPIGELMWLTAGFSDGKRYGIEVLVERFDTDTGDLYVYPVMDKAVPVTILSYANKPKGVE